MMIEELWKIEMREDSRRMARTTENMEAADIQERNQLSNETDVMPAVNTPGQCQALDDSCIM